MAKNLSNEVMKRLMLAKKFTLFRSALLFYFIALSLHCFCCPSSPICNLPYFCVDTHQASEFLFLPVSSRSSLVQGQPPANQMPA
jgi:hypothetical protein